MFPQTCTPSSSSPPSRSVSPKASSASYTHHTKLSSARVVDYVVDCVSETVDYALSQSAPENIPPRGTSHWQKFTSFVSLVLSEARVTPATLLVALAYIVRLRADLIIFREQRTPERIFLGALVVASKYTQDSSLNNANWARCARGVFETRDVNLIEREVLCVLDWDLRVRELDLLAHRRGLSFRASGAASSSCGCDVKPFLKQPRHRGRRLPSVPVDAVPSPIQRWKGNRRQVGRLAPFT